MNRDLFLAILAMDTYNRDYGAGVKLKGDKLGNAITRKFESPGINQDQYENWQSAGFYAIAYEWNGETIISYRGTDKLLTDAVDNYQAA